MVIDELPARHIPKRAECPIFIELSSPGFNRELGSLLNQKLVLVQTFNPTRAVEALNKRILYWFPWLDEV
jgi:hypothetical protein